jgi:hypothetical protein
MIFCREVPREIDAAIQLLAQGSTYFKELLNYSTGSAGDSY